MGGIRLRMGICESSAAEQQAEQRRAAATSAPSFQVYIKVQGTLYGQFQVDLQPKDTVEALLRAAAKTLGVSECPLLLEPWFGGKLIEHAARLEQCGIRNGTQVTLKATNNQTIEQLKTEIRKANSVDVLSAAESGDEAGIERVAMYTPSRLVGCEQVLPVVVMCAVHRF